MNDLKRLIEICAYGFANSILAMYFIALLYFLKTPAMVIVPIALIHGFICWAYLYHLSKKSD